LCEELLEGGHTVFGVDKLPGRYTQFEEDLLGEQVAEVLIDNLRPQVVVHLAAQVGRLFGEQDLRHTIESNGVMTGLVAQSCAAIGAELVYASTSEVYGDQGEAWCIEGGPLKLPHNLYGLSKRWGEEVCALYAPRRLKILRLSMPYGPGVVPGRGRAALPNMLWQAHNLKEIPVHMGAERSWCYVDDTVRGIRLVVEKGEGIYNVGRDDQKVSMAHVAVKACDIANAPESLIKMVGAPVNQTVVKRLNTERLVNLGWEPRVDLQDGMELVYRWVKQFDGEGRKVA
jgi:nucleoside-diphosphate-sugar epimerase